jgi:hypothetical protein
MHRLSNRLVAPRLRGQPLVAYPNQVPRNLSECRRLLAHQPAVSARWLATKSTVSSLLPPPQIERKQEKEYLSLFGEESKGYQESVEQQLTVQTNKTTSSDELSPPIMQEGMDMLPPPKIERKQETVYLSLFAEESKGHLESVEQQLSVQTNKTHSCNEVSPSIVQEGMDMEEGETSQESSQNTHEAYQYLYQLNKYYRDVHDVSLKHAFLSEEIVQEENKKLWTATFTCPVLGERVEAGKLTGKYTELDGRHYYAKKKVAMQAAAMEAHVQQRGRS